MARNADLFGNAARKEPPAQPGLKSQGTPSRKTASGTQTPGTPSETSYTAASIECWKARTCPPAAGHVYRRHRRGALHHLFAEALDNAMDEAVAGHASFIDVRLEASGFLTVIDNGRGIPVDPHPKFRRNRRLKSS